MIESLKMKMILAWSSVLARDKCYIFCTGKNRFSSPSAFVDMAFFTDTATTEVYMDMETLISLMN